MFPNKFNGHCECGCSVHAGEGFTEKVGLRYVTYCSQCAPIPKRILTKDGKVFAPYEPQNLDTYRSMPGARWNKIDKCWDVSLALVDRPKLLQLANFVHLDIDPELLTENLISPEAKIAKNLGLYPFQVEGVDFLSQRTHALLGDQMGLGKSCQSIMGAPKGGKILVVCQSGLKYSWFDEVKKWRKDFNPVVLKNKNEFRWPIAGEVVIVNNEQLPDAYIPPKRIKAEPMPKYWERLKQFRKDLQLVNSGAQGVHLIIDEAHLYKNSQSIRSKKMKEIVKLASKVIGLTGSPLDNVPSDLYGVLDTLGMANKVFGSWERFQTLFNVNKEQIRTRRGTISKTNWGKPSPLVSQLLQSVMLRRLRSEVLPDLPPKTYSDIVVDSNNQIRKNLDNLWLSWKEKITAGRLPPFEKFAEVREKIAKSRIPAMMEIIENFEEQETPLVVFSSHLAPLDHLLGRPGWAVISGLTKPAQRNEIVKAFQDGFLKGIGITIKAAIGINLTYAANGLFVDLDWSPAANWQAEDRLVRIGQHANKVNIMKFVSDHPLDIHLNKMLADKIDTIDLAINKVVKIENENDDDFLARIDRMVQTIGVHG